MSTGSKKWPASAWRDLLARILPIIEEEPGLGPFSLGGGTALALWLDHRVSYDIGLFFGTAQAPRTLSPQRNARARAEVSDVWQEPGH